MISETHIEAWIYWLNEALKGEDMPLTELDRERIGYILNVLDDELSTRASAEKAEI